MADISTEQSYGIMTEIPGVARNYKDRVFRMVFKEKKALLALYNAMNGTVYEDEEALTVTTLENAIYMEMKNDVSFVLYDQLLLYEHQSTKNPNIPLRNLFYVSDVYSALTREDFLYGGISVKIPEPKFVVFYNGVESMEEREVLKLSGLYQKTSEHAALELETVVLNINIGYNRELMERCKELHDYAEFVGRVRENLKSKNPLLHAVNEAVEYCIRNDILAEFLKKNRSEVIKMSIYEYDAEKVQRQFREQWKQMGLEEGRQEGRQEGRAEGRQTGIEISAHILQLSRQGKTVKEIVEATGESIEVVRMLLGE